MLIGWLLDSSATMTVQGLSPASCFIRSTRLQISIFLQKVFDIQDQTKLSSFSKSILFLSFWCISSVKLAFVTSFFRRTFGIIDRFRLWNHASVIGRGLDRGRRFRRVVLGGNVGFDMRRIFGRLGARDGGKAAKARHIFRGSETSPCGRIWVWDWVCKDATAGKVGTWEESSLGWLGYFSSKYKRGNWGRLYSVLIPLK